MQKCESRHSRSAYVISVPSRAFARAPAAVIFRDGAVIFAWRYGAEIRRGAAITDERHSNSSL
jgi:hypothetical protein